MLDVRIYFKVTAIRGFGIRSIRMDIGINGVDRRD